MATFVLRRFLYSVPVLALSSFLSFTFVSLAGDPLARLRSNPQLSPVTVANLKVQYHLNQWIPVRYWYWLQDVTTHRLGDSLQTLQPIWPDIVRTLGHTAQVVLLAEALAIVVGVAVGILSAVRQYSVFDYVATSLSFLGFAMPTFWLALLLQILFVDIYLRVGRPDLLRLRPEQPARGDVVARPAPAHRPAGDDALGSSASRSTAATCGRRCWT